MVHAPAGSAKTILRLTLRDRRKSLAAESPDAAQRAAEQLPLDRLPPFAIVAGYRARGGEIDAWPLMRRLAGAGARLALPAALDRDSALSFRAFAEGDALEPDVFNIAAPTASARELIPDLVIAPLLAFDRRGYRLGQGAGHYDRTLGALRARKTIFVLGLAYAGQEVGEVPAEAHDQRLDAILTEKAYIAVRKDF